VRAFDGQGAWTNTAALRRAGIERGAGVPRTNEVVVDATGRLAREMMKACRQSGADVGRRMPERATT
jgi:predicted amidohydrolase YtcJ